MAARTTSAECRAALPVAPWAAIDDMSELPDRTCDLAGDPVCDIGYAQAAGARTVRVLRAPTANAHDQAPGTQHAGEDVLLDPNR